MKTTLTALAITALVAGGTTIALGAAQTPPDPQQPRLEQRGPQGPAQLRGRGQRGPGFVRQGPGAMQGRGPRRGGPALRGLDLTDAQKDQVKALHEKLRADIEAVLTPEQLEKLKARRGGGR